jgi:tetratricopeptide (TPR) repeat protein
MQFVSNVDALIIDLRRNGGGNPATIQYICSYFFAERTHLNSLYWRQGDRTEEFWTLDDVEGAKMPIVPIFVLTSRRTFSGGEEFAYNLKTRKRATLIGETTGGGANPGGGFPLPEGFSMFVPTGRAINPVTGTNWEGTGVEPDIACASDEAYDLALEQAAAAAEKYRDRELQMAAESIKVFRAGIEDAQDRYAKGDIQSGDALVRGALAKGLASGLFDERSVNDLGYSLLGEEQFDAAIGVFRFNVEQFPESWNTYDSLAEAYMTKGETKRAIEYYRKSLELNPDNEGAKQNIKKMGGTL